MGRGREGWQGIENAFWDDKRQERGRGCFEPRWRSLDRGEVVTNDLLPEYGEAPRF